MLAPAATHLVEDAAPGGGRNGVSGGGGGEPLRYSLTSRGFMAFGPWNDPELLYCVSQLNLGNNSLSRIQVVSALNTLNIATHMYYYYIGNCTQNYYPKVYMGTTQTVTYYWNHDNQNGTVTDQIYTKNIWPQNFGQTTQKGEANT